MIWTVEPESVSGRIDLWIDRQKASTRGRALQKSNSKRTPVLFDEIVDDAAHTGVDLGIGGGGGGKDLGGGLGVGSGSEFGAAVVDERTHGFRRDFKMELQSQRAATDLECLIFAGSAAGELYCARRQVEGFAMPVEGLKFLRKAEPVAIGRNAFDGKPADLFLVVSVDAGAERAGDELGTETHAEHGHAALHGFTNEAFLLTQPGQLGFVVDAHRAAHRDDQVEAVQWRERGVFEKPRGADDGLPFGERRGDAGETFKGSVLQDVDFHSR